MKILFHVDYQTTFGEQLVVNIIGNGGATDSCPMQTNDGQHWYCELTSSKHPDYFDYYYSVCRGEQVMRTEWLAEPHRLELAAKNGSRYVVYDHWLDIPEDAYLYTSAFTDCVMARERQMSTKSEFERTIRLKVRAPQLRQNECLAIVGAPTYLGG